MADYKCGKCGGSVYTRIQVTTVIGFVQVPDSTGDKFMMDPIGAQEVTYFMGIVAHRNLVLPDPVREKYYQRPECHHYFLQKLSIAYRPSAISQWGLEAWYFSCLWALGLNKEKLGHVSVVFLHDQ